MSEQSRPADTLGLQDRWGVLAARDVVKTYGGVTALSGAEITLRAGQIHALVGENGAGKSTLVKVLCGVVPPDAGTIRVDGSEVAFGNARDAGAAGIAFVAQELSLFPELSVRENLFPLTPERTVRRDQQARAGPAGGSGPRATRVSRSRCTRRAASSLWPTSSCSRSAARCSPGRAC